MSNNYHNYSICQNTSTKYYGLLKAEQLKLTIKLCVNKLLALQQTMKTQIRLLLQSSLIGVYTICSGSSVPIWRIAFLQYHKYCSDDYKQILHVKAFWNKIIMLRRTKKRKDKGRKKGDKIMHS